MYSREKQNSSVRRNILDLSCFFLSEILGIRRFWMSRSPFTSCKCDAWIVTLNLWLLLSVLCTFSFLVLIDSIMKRDSTTFWESLLSLIPIRTWATSFLFRFMVTKYWSISLYRAVLSAKWMALKLLKGFVEVINVN